VSFELLENLVRVLQLDAAERRHLFLLARKQEPPGRYHETRIPSELYSLLDALGTSPGCFLLITGGTSGIGLELASRLQRMGNKVIVTGRDPVKLNEIKNNMPQIHVIQSDLSDPKAIARLQQHVVTEFPKLNVIINNAGIMRKINLHHFDSHLEDITREIEVNLSGSIHMVMQFLPHLMKQSEAAIVTVSSGLAFVPYPISPIYCAAKAGIHSFSQSLRIQLKNTTIKVFELAPPATNTPLNHAFDPSDLNGPLMSVTKLVNQTIEALKKNRLEICPGPSKVLKLLSRVAPQLKPPG
jgi:uncharacterized oxidoreductase